MSIETELREMIAKELAVDDGEVKAEAHLQDDLGGDSLMLVELAAAISDRYGVDLDADDLVDVGSFGELVTLVGAKAKEG